MKKLLSIIFLFIVTSLSAQTIGDYRSGQTAVTWATASNWQTWDGTKWVTANSAPSSTNDVYVQAGHTATLGAAGTCNNLFISTGTTGTGTGGDGLVALAGNVLSISGKLSCYFGAVNTTLNSTSALSLTASNVIPSSPITKTANSNTGRIKFVGNSRTITTSTEWAASNTAATTTFDLEVALTAGQTATMASGIKAYNWYVTSGTLDADSNRIAADNNTSGNGNLSISSGATLISAQSGGTSNSVVSRTGTAATGVCGTFTLDGTLKLSGAAPQMQFTTFIINSGSTIEYNGGTQNLVISSYTGAGTLSNYYNLILNGTNNKTLPFNITINGTLTTTNVFVITNNFTLTIGNSISNLGNIVINGGGIIGSLKRWFATGATGTTNFPMINRHWVTGNGLNFDDVNVDINFTSAPSTGGTLTVKYDTTGSGTLSDNGGIGYIDAGSLWPGVNFINLSPQKWTITTGDGLTGFVYDINLTGTGMNLSTTATLYTAIVKRTNNTQPWAWNVSNHVMTTGSATPILHGTGFNSFSEFAVVGNVDNLLPIELESFISTVRENTVKLNWITSYEENNSGFDIERKLVNTIDWKKIGNVISNDYHQYSYTDLNLNSGKYNYRLKQIDYNGNYKYYELSNEVIITTPIKYSLNQNYPNPFNPTTTIKYQISEKDFVNITVYDISGKEIDQIVNQIQQPGYYTIEYNAKNLGSGVYFYKISTNNFTLTKKMVLIK